MRKTVFIVMAALLLLGMTACGNSMEQQPSQTENIEQEQTVTENTQTEVGIHSGWIQKSVRASGNFGKADLSDVGVLLL